MEMSVLAAALVAIFLTIVAISLPSLHQTAYAPILVLGLLNVLAARLPISLWSRGAANLATATTLAGLALYGPAAAALVALPAGASAAWGQPARSLSHRLFAVALPGAAAGLAGYIYPLLGGEVPFGGAWLDAIGLGLSACVYLALEQAGLALQRRLERDGTPVSPLRSTQTGLALAVLGVSLAHGYQVGGPWLLVGVALAVFLAWRTLEVAAAERRRGQAFFMTLRRRLTDPDEGWAVARGALSGLARVADARDRYDGQHGEEAMRFARETASRLGLDQRGTVIAELAALLHDLGKASIPADVLDKPGLLSEDELGLVRQHPALGASMIESIVALAEDLAPAVLLHHERFDGTGFPEERKGTEIPVAAQIAGVIETYQAMVSDRPYRRALDHSAAVAELRRQSGTQFNPAVVDAIVEL
ncbi:MAG: HD-GYP domain-containing protein, partial [Chloroflexota bacterium]